MFQGHIFTVPGTNRTGFEFWVQYNQIRAGHKIFISEFLNLGIPHCTKNSKQIFPEIKMCGFVPNFCIHVSGSHLYIPTIGPPILLNCVCGLIVRIYESLTDT
jgi:hypothetical protein